MIESIPQNEMQRLDLSSKIQGYYVEENPKSILIRVESGTSFWVPKRFIDSIFFNNTNLIQEFVIDNWLLRKIGFQFDKYQKN